MQKLLLVAMICTSSLVYCLQNNIIVSNANTHIFATNFPAPGWPVCSKCGTYHPGEDCPKDEEGNQK